MFESDREERIEARVAALKAQRIILDASEKISKAPGNANAMLEIVGEEKLPLKQAHSVMEQMESVFRHVAAQEDAPASILVRHDEHGNLRLRASRHIMQAMLEAMETDRKRPWSVGANLLGPFKAIVMRTPAEEALELFRKAGDERDHDGSETELGGMWKELARGENDPVSGRSETAYKAVLLIEGSAQHRKAVRARIFEMANEAAEESRAAGHTNAAAMVTGVPCYVKGLDMELIKVVVDVSALARLTHAVTQEQKEINREVRERMQPPSRARRFIRALGAETAFGR